MNFKSILSKSLLFSFFAFTIFSCEMIKELTVINNSSSNIHCYYNCDSTLDNINFFRNGYFPDKSEDSIYVTSSNFVAKNSQQNLSKYGSNAWKNYLENCNNYVYFFFFEDSVINNNSNQDLISKKMYIKRVKFSLKELEKSNWTITYP